MLRSQAVAISWEVGRAARRAGSGLRRTEVASAALGGGGQVWGRHRWDWRGDLKRSYRHVGPFSLNNFSPLKM